MLYRGIIAVCSEIHTKHINPLCGKNVGFVNVTPGGTYSGHWGLRGLYLLYTQIQSVPRSEHSAPQL